MSTRGTEIAAIEAARNEARVLAEGGLLGERRAALGRLAMVVAFGLIARTTKDSSIATMASGLGYSIFAIVTFLVVRKANVNIASSRRRPVMVATVDTLFVSSQAILDVVDGRVFEPGMLAVALAIVMSFSIARNPIWQVIYSCGLALACFAGVHGVVAGLAPETKFAIWNSLFMLGGLAVLATSITLTNVAVRNMFTDLRKRDNLTRFLPSQVAERVMAIGPDALAPVEREVTVLFSDIRGFTAMSEGMSPRVVLLMLDDYFGRMGLVVKGHDGVVGKFLGDGMLAYWGVPDKLEDHAVKAVRAARDMRRVVEELNQHRVANDLLPIKIGIGIHTGMVAAGMLGGKLQSEYTVIGDAVNVASRVEGLTKEHGVDLLVSETTWAQLPPEAQQGAKLAAAEIRGRREPIVLYALDA